MGVLACNRNNCDNIMCDYYSFDFGYLCSECMNELITLCKFRNRVDPGIIKYFMRSRKSDYVHDDAVDVNEGIGRYFKYRE